MNAIVLPIRGERIRLRKGENAQMIVDGKIRRGMFIDFNLKYLTVVSVLDVFRFSAKTLRLTGSPSQGELRINRRRESLGLVRDRKKKAKM